ncbi:MAG: beta-ketoacyl synthase chain length factor [Treponema sp.]|nr:beta-ketoacyl synthase chain length factor [Treponema sp.]
MTVTVSHIAAWAPGITSADDWKKWATGELHIACTKDAPKLEYTDMLFRRRLSQISKMTVQVVHDVLERAPHAKTLKQVFISCRGELAREFSVSKTLVEEHAILPANFSLSVFNTPIALATIALGLRGGYSVIYPSKGDFCAAFQGACAPLFAGSENKILLVYADEFAPEEYSAFGTASYEPLAFAAILSREGNEAGSTSACMCASTNAHSTDTSATSTNDATITLHDISVELADVPHDAASFLKLIINKDTA